MDAKKQKGVASSGEPIAFDEPACLKIKSKTLEEWAILMMPPEAYHRE
jgi:hypothetical protein